MKRSRVWLYTQRECFADASSHPGWRDLADFERGSADHRSKSGYRIEPPSDWESVRLESGSFCDFVIRNIAYFSLDTPADGES
jgi:hypothetical protein